jgi:hypothetical protein
LIQKETPIAVQMELDGIVAKDATSIYIAGHTTRRQKIKTPVEQSETGSRPAVGPFTDGARIFYLLHRGPSCFNATIPLGTCYRQVSSA